MQKCLCLTYEKFLIFTQSKAKACLFYLVVLTQHPFAGCKSKLALRGKRWDSGFLTSEKSSQSLR